MKDTSHSGILRSVDADEVWKRVVLLVFSVILGVLIAQIQPWMRAEIVVLRKPGPFLLAAIVGLTLDAIRRRESAQWIISVSLFFCWALFLDYLPSLLRLPQNLLPLPAFVWTCLGVVPVLVATLATVQTGKLSRLAKLGWLFVSGYVQGVFFYNLAQDNHYMTFF